MLSSLLPFMLFAFVASITPGPTNILVLSNSARYGLKAALPIILGACAGAAGLVLLVGSGFGQSLVHWPKVQTAMHWIGIAWLSYLAWQIFSAPTQALDVAVTDKPLGLIGAACLQVINPKTWMMALAVVSVFAGNGAEHQVLYLPLVFFPTALPRRLGRAGRGVRPGVAFAQGDATLQSLHGPALAGFDLAECTDLKA
jgi:threonine/homoserine/homoserine lactone efflux protein